MYNFPEESAWEDPSQSRDLLNDFLEQCQEISNPEDLQIANTHRIGNVTETQENNNAGNRNNQARPLIFRTLFWEDHEKILEKASKLLKVYNQANNTRYGVSQQLPKRMMDNKKELWGQFKQARKDKLRAKWRIDYENAVYYLVVDGKEIRPKNNSTNDLSGNSSAR